MTDRAASQPRAMARALVVGAVVTALVAAALIARASLASPADVIISQPRLLSQAIYADMVDHGEVDPRVVAYRKNRAGRLPPSPALSRDLLDTQATVSSRLEHMSPSSKRAVARAYADTVMADASVVDRLGLSAWDLLWLVVPLIAALGSLVVWRPTA